MFTVDGVQWSIPCDITRTAKMTASDISGVMLNKQYFNDVLGTYMQYEISICPNPHEMGDYHSLFEILSQPVDGHQFALPYNNETIEITGRVSDISDIYVRMPGGAVYWKGTSFTVTSNAPSKTESLSTTISRGMTPLPDVYDAEIGDNYIMTVNGWEWFADYPDADSMAF